MSWIVIIAALVLAVIYFMPGLLLPNYSFSALTLTKGLEIMGQKVIKGNLIFALELVIPLIIAAIWLKVKGKNKSKLSLLAAAAYLILKIASVEMCKKALLNLVSPSLSFWFVLAVLLTLVIIVIDILIIAGKINEKDGVSQAAVKAASVVSSAAERKGVSPAKSGRICPNCGNKVDNDSDFCVFCGTKYVEPMIRKCISCGMTVEEDDEFCPFCGAKVSMGKKKICSQCGKQLNDDDDFCPYCGAKYTDPNLRICHICGTKLRPGTDFCVKCGTRFEE